VAVRDVVQIDERLCDGCGDCVPSCAEGAIQIIDGKARLVGDVYCDGLGACLGHCPQGAITVVRREAESFDQEAVDRHLATLRSPPPPPAAAGLPLVSRQAAASCPGSRVVAFGPAAATRDDGQAVPSRLRQWPIQLHLLPPTAPFLQGAELLLAADCVAFAVGGFHQAHLDGRALAIACPKLDSQQEVYVAKLAAMIDLGGIRSLEVMVMEVPCCSGLVRLAEEALARAARTVPLRVTVAGIRGEVTCLPTR
jgi:Pyruvate/2-oxoacid:ferredoxin oxidoreductase delta subunit